MTGGGRPRLRVALVGTGWVMDFHARAVREHPGAELVAAANWREPSLQTLAERRGVRCDVLTAEGGSTVERLASLTAMPDFASLYLALAHGLDPMAVPAISEMKELSNPLPEGMQ